MENRKIFNVRLLKKSFLTLLLTTLLTISFNQSTIAKENHTLVTKAKKERSTFDHQRFFNDFNFKVEKIHRTNAVKLIENSTISGDFISEMEKEAFQIINEIRAERGLAKLLWSVDMAKIARLHSGNMAKHKFFSHNGIDGLMVNDRADALGIYDWSAIGENIAYTRGYENAAEFTCENWMKSTSHRNNILNRRWQESAIGVAKALDGTIYFTQVFFTK